MALEIERTPHGLPKIRLGDNQPVALLNQEHLRTEIRQHGLDYMIQDGFIPPQDPNPNELVTSQEFGIMRVFRAPNFPNAASGHVLLDDNCVPIVNEADIPAGEEVQRHAPGQPLAGQAIRYRLSMKEIETLVSSSNEDWDRRRRIYEKFEERFKTFIETVEKYVSKSSLKQLQDGFAARNPRQVWLLLERNVAHSHTIAFADQIRQYAHVIDWGIRESWNQYAQRKQILFDQLAQMADPVSDLRKKEIYVKTLIGVTGNLGPYMTVINRAMENAAMTAQQVSEAVIAMEAQVVAMHDPSDPGDAKNKRFKKDKLPTCDDTWLPYDGKKHESKRETKWVFDQATADSYLDPAAISAAALTTSTSGNTKGKNNGNKGSNSNKGKNSNSKSAAREPICPICKGKHFVSKCSQAYKCSNATCNGWHHRKGQACDGGKERSEFMAKKNAKKASATTASASTSEGALPKTDAATQASVEAALTSLSAQITSLQEDVRRSRNPGKRRASAATLDDYDSVDEDN